MKDNFLQKVKYRKQQIDILRKGISSQTYLELVTTRSNMNRKFVETTQKSQSQKFIEWKAKPLTP
jgi:hypothetical protein